MNRIMNFKRATMVIIMKFKITTFVIIMKFKITTIVMIKFKIWTHEALMRNDTLGTYERIQLGTCIQYER